MSLTKTSYSMIQGTPINILDYGADPTGSNDSTEAMQAARDFIAAQTNPPALIFPAGIYKYSVSPNWAIQDAVIVPDGEVRLRYTGTGNAVILDSSSDTYNVTFGTPSNKFIIEAPSTAGHGVYVNAVHHSSIAVNVQGCGSTSAGLRVDFAVCTDFYPVISRNESGSWYLDAQPMYGIYTYHRSVGEPVSYCVFHTPIVEWTVYGLYNKHSNGNMYLGGTFEGCSNNGIFVDTLGSSDKYIGIDLEANNQSGGSYADIFCIGAYNTFIECDTMDLFQFGGGATGNVLQGGIHQSIHLDPANTGNLVTGAGYKRGLGTGNLLNQGTKNRIIDTQDMQTNTWYSQVLPTVSPVVGSSPYSYTNTYDYSVSAVVTSGTVSQITITRSPGSPVSLGVTPGMVNLAPGDVLTITYTIAPFLVIYPQPVL